MSIITDESSLRQISKRVEVDNGLSLQDELIVHKLIDAIPENGLGLSAPQIEHFVRIFIAKFSFGNYVFVNPVISNLSLNKMPSLEGCLSLPGVTRQIERHYSLTLSADLVFLVKDNQIEPSKDKQFDLSERDAYISQHEYDHLNGILIIDYPETQSEKVLAIQQDRKNRILSKRQNIKNKNKKQNSINYKKYQKIKKQIKTFNKRKNRQIEIAERLRAEEFGLDV